MADRFPLIIDNSAEKIKELVSGDNLDLTKSNLKNADHIQSAGVNVACACPAAASGQAVDATSGNCQCQPNFVLNVAGDTCEGKCDKCH